MHLDIVKRTFPNTPGGMPADLRIALAWRKNNAIHAQLDIERYHKLINEIYLSTWGIGIDTFTITQLDNLRQIASLCYREAGTAAFKARVLLSTVEESEYLTACTDMLVVETQKLETGDKNYSRDFVVSPNPAQNYLRIQYYLQENQEGTFEILGLHKLYLAHSLTQGKQIGLLNLEGIPNGFYIFRFEIDGSDFFFGKLIILR